MTQTQNITTPIDYSLLILSGGEGRRMGGIDKGLLDWQGEPLIARVKQALPTTYRECLISCNRNPQHYRQYGRIVADEVDGFQGPLAGILAGLHACYSPRLLILPCDNPSPPPTLLQLLAEHADDDAIVYAFDGHRHQYLYALIAKTATASLERYLQTEQRSVHRWYQAQQARWVDCSQWQDHFSNINDRQGLKKLSSADQNNT